MDTKICCECNNIKNISEFHKRTRSSDGLHFYCKECCKKYYKLNQEERKKYSSTYRAENLISTRLSSLIHYSLNKDQYRATRQSYYRKNKEVIDSYNSQYRKDNRGECNALTAKYRAKRLQATPKWLSEEQLKEIREFYTLAQELAWLNQDGKVFHVDHMMPLQGENLSGLHVPWNLQLLPASENFKKNNKYQDVK